MTHAQPEAARQLLRIPLDEIETDGRLRPVDPTMMAQLRASMAAQGQMVPIEVRRGTAKPWRLVFGAHRVEVARDLGWPTIEAVLFEGSDGDAILREVEENVHRAELNALDEAVAIGAGEAIYRERHPTAKHGGDRTSVAARAAAATRPPSYADELALKSGISPRTIRRALHRYKGLEPDVRTRLRGTEIGKKGSALDHLCDVPGSDQLAVVALILDADPKDPHRPRTIWQARALVGRGARPEPDRVARWLAKAAGFTPEQRRVARLGFQRLVREWETAEREAAKVVSAGNKGEGRRSKVA